MKSVSKASVKSPKYSESVRLTEKPHSQLAMTAGMIARRLRENMCFMLVMRYDDVDVHELVCLMWFGMMNSLLICLAECDVVMFRSRDVLNDMGTCDEKCQSIRKHTSSSLSRIMK